MNPSTREDGMQTKATFRGTMKLGEVVEAAYALGGPIAPDDATRAALAARRIERVLARAGDLRMQGALIDLARELKASRRRTPLSNARCAAAAR
jgi:hypothetical protein